MRNIWIALSSLFLVFCFYSCESPDDDDNNLSLTIDPLKASQGIFKTTLTTTPDIGTEATIFSLTANVLQDANRAVDYFARWDLDGDGIYDTEWLDSLTYSTNGGVSQNVKVQVIDSESYSEVDSVTVRIAELVPITSNTSNSFQGNADIHPDGTRLIFDWRPTTPGHQIYEYNLLDATTTMLIAETAHWPDYSYDGNYISFNKSDVGICVYNTLTASIEEVIPDSLSLTMWCRWSPIENKFLYLSKLGLQLYDYDNKIDSVILDDYYYTYCWSPDGEYLAIGNQGGLSGTSSLEILRLDDLTIIKTYADIPVGHKLDWSPDGNWICLGVANKPIIAVLNYLTDEVITIEPSPLVGPWYPSWSPDGASLYFEGQAGNTKLSIWNMGFPL